MPGAQIKLLHVLRFVFNLFGIKKGSWTVGGIFSDTSKLGISPRVAALKGKKGVFASVSFISVTTPVQLMSVKFLFNKPYKKYSLP